MLKFTEIVPHDLIIFLLKSKKRTLINHDTTGTKAVFDDVEYTAP